jgi:hypothetical protein
MVCPVYRINRVHLGRFWGELLPGVSWSGGLVVLCPSWDGLLLDGRRSWDKIPLAVGLNPGENTEELSFISVALSCPGAARLGEAKSILRAMFSKARGESRLCEGEFKLRKKIGVSFRLFLLRTPVCMLSLLPNNLERSLSSSWTRIAEKSRLLDDVLRPLRRGGFRYSRGFLGAHRKASSPK